MNETIQAEIPTIFIDSENAEQFPTITPYNPLNSFNEYLVVVQQTSRSFYISTPTIRIIIAVVISIQILFVSFIIIYIIVPFLEHKYVGQINDANT
jgi:hypothetical protein